VRSVVAELLTALALALLALIAGWFIDRERGAWILVLAVACFSSCGRCGWCSA